MLSAIVAALHLLTLAVGFAAVVERGRALSEPLDEAGRARLFRADNVYGIAALFWYGTGFYRLLGGLEKGTAFYVSSPLFWVKMGLLATAGLVEMWPMVTFIRWRYAERRGEQPDTRRARLFFYLNSLEIVLIACAVFAASAMARGIGRAPPLVDGPCGVQEIFASRCASCHGGAQRLAGLDLSGDPAAALVGVPSSQFDGEVRVRPLDPEGSLLFKKISGRLGEARGLAMPPGGGLDGRERAVIEGWIRSGAGRCEGRR